MVIDATGNLQPDLLALTLQGKKKTPTVKLWENREGSFSMFVYLTPSCPLFELLD
jgi:hypothetical protein